MPAQPLIRPALNWMNLVGTSYGTLVFLAVDASGALILVPQVGFAFVNDAPVTAALESFLI